MCTNGVFSAPHLVLVSCLSTKGNTLSLAPTPNLNVVLCPGFLSTLEVLHYLL